MLGGFRNQSTVSAGDKRCRRALKMRSGALPTSSVLGSFCSGKCSVRYICLRRSHDSDSCAFVRLDSEDDSPGEEELKGV